MDVLDWRGRVRKVGREYAGGRYAAFVPFLEAVAEDVAQAWRTPAGYYASELARSEAILGPETLTDPEIPAAGEAAKFLGRALLAAGAAEELAGSAAVPIAVVDAVQSFAREPVLRAAFRRHVPALQVAPILESSDVPDFRPDLVAILDRADAMARGWEEAE